MGYSRSKTLATVGEGTLHVKDTENSDDLERLNRDTSKVNKELYSGSVGTSVEATLDHRLLTEDGRKQIAEDVKKASNAFSAMGDAITKDEVGLKNFFEHQGVVDTNYEVMKQFIQAEDGKYAKIWNDQANATPEQIQEATNAFSKVIAYQYNISLDEAKLIATDSFIKGANYNQPTTNTIVINANGNNNALDYAETGTHEGTHAAMNQGAISNRETSELNEAYARLMEGYGNKDFVFVYTNAGYGEVKTDNVNKPIAQGDSAIIDRNTDWFIDKAINDPKNVDYRVVVYSRPVVNSLGITMNHLFGVVDQRENGEPSKIFSLSGNGVMIDGGTPTIYMGDLANVNADKNSKNTLEKDKGYLVDGFKEAQVIQVPKGISQTEFDNIVLENAKSYNILTNQYPTISQTINAAIDVLFGSNNNPSSEYRNSNTYIDNVIEQSGGQIKDFENAILQNSGETSEKNAKETAKKLNISNEQLEKEIKQYQGLMGELK
ncbi:MAG: hypothetical protein EOL95_11495 [Bacteroidia bacterium]|nr:hypothetical protein [Bacteroidia bacterium]